MVVLFLEIKGKKGPGKIWGQVLAFDNYSRK
jgi:hypothetical protein